MTGKKPPMVSDMERRVLEAVKKSWAMPKYSARAFNSCVRKGWVAPDGYLELTPAGRAAFKTAARKS